MSTANEYKIPAVIGITGTACINAANVEDVSARILEELKRLIKGKKRTAENIPIILLFAWCGDETANNPLTTLVDKVKSDERLKENVTFLPVVTNTVDGENAEKWLTESSVSVPGDYCEDNCSCILAPDTEGKGKTEDDYLQRQVNIYIASHAALVIDVTQNAQDDDMVQLALFHNYSTSDGTIFQPPTLSLYRIFIDGSTPDCYLSSGSFEGGQLTAKQSDDMPKYLSVFLDKLARYNSDEGGSTDSGMSDLWYDDRKPEHKQFSLEYKLQKRILFHYDKANCLSTKYRDKRKLCNNFLSAFAALIALAFMVASYSDYVSWASWGGIGMTLISVVLVLIFENKKHYTDKYVEYRVLAEAMRFQFYLSVYGINAHDTDYLIWAQKNIYSWIVHAASAITLGDNSEGLDYTGIQDEMYDGIVEKWIGEEYDKDKKDENGDTLKIGQLGYLGYKVGLVMEDAKKSKVIGFIKSWTNPALYALIMFIRFISVSENADTVIKIFGFIFAVIGCVAAFFSALYGNIAYSRDQEEYENLLLLYRASRQKSDAIAKEDDPKNAKSEAHKYAQKQRINLLRELACEATLENGMWLSYYSTMRLKVFL